MMEFGGKVVSSYSQSYGLGVWTNSETRRMMEFCGRVISSRSRSCFSRSSSAACA